MNVLLMLHSYLPEATANSSASNLTYASSTRAVLRVDNTDTDASKGRSSVRITSKKQYEDMLIVYDITVCATTSRFTSILLTMKSARPIRMWNVAGSLDSRSLSLACERLVMRQPSFLISSLIHHVR